MKDYLQPAATLLVAIGLGFIALDQSRTTTARFNCAEIFGSSKWDAKRDLAKLGLPEDGNYNQIRGYYRGFISPEASSGGGFASIDFPSSIDVKITDMPTVKINDAFGSLDVRVNGDISTMVRGEISTY